LIGTSQGRTKIVFGTIPNRVSRREARDNHNSGRLGIVYANEIALDAINKKQTLPFPEGSIFVREKFAKPDDTEPELLAVMIKREQGFNPDRGNWLFLVSNGKMTKVTQRQKRGECVDCHAGYQFNNDLVFPLVVNK